MSADPYMTDYAGPTDEAWFAEQARRFQLAETPEPPAWMNEAPPIDDEAPHRVAEPVEARRAAGELAATEAPGEPVPAIAAAWPEPPAEAAYHGIAGDIVRAVQDHTEADPVALLGTILATFGALAGRYCRIYQGAEQAANLYVALVGDSAVGRKGTAGSVGRAIFDAATPGWHSTLVPGLGSGEGLVTRLRTKPDGSTDHRALVYETEFGRLLTIMARDGSTLSPTLRDGWDGSPIGRFLAREADLITWHHVGMLAHVTPVELREKLTSTDAANGFGNRFLWLAVRRSHLEPFPVNPRGLVAPYTEALRWAVEEAQRPRDVAWSPAVAARWREEYAALADRPRLGLAGAITSRAEAQITRLALVYALLDRSEAVELVHFDAALALWDYARRSAVHIFGESTGNRHADLVLRLLRAGHELDRQTVKAETGLRLGADLDAVEAALVSAGLAESVDAARTDGRAGRPRRVLRLRRADLTGLTAPYARADLTELTGLTAHSARAGTSTESVHARHAVSPVSTNGVREDGAARVVLPVSPVSPVRSGEDPDDAGDPVALAAVPPEPPDLFALASEPPCFGDGDDYRAHASDHYRDGAGWACRRCEAEVPA